VHLTAVGCANARRQSPGVWPNWRLKLRLNDCCESKPSEIATLTIGSPLLAKRYGVDIQFFFQIVVDPRLQIGNETRRVHADAPIIRQGPPLPDAHTLQQFRFKCNFYYCIYQKAASILHPINVTDIDTLM
jgi:hypothetical protein